MVRVPRRQRPRLFRRCGDIAAQQFMERAEDLLGQARRDGFLRAPGLPEKGGQAFLSRRIEKTVAAKHHLEPAQHGPTGRLRQILGAPADPT